ncbi:M48 family metalloprotease [Streptomyces sp. NPDC101160]|uniref:M48 family metalloprotease n=1 Tax=Streptomyces sp. NPDC101160 TaxID=3366118 RepID=UPI0038300543
MGQISEQIAERISEQDCPECGARVPVDRRFVVWCAGCGWNVDPARDTAAEEDEGPVERVRRELARRHGEQLFAVLAQEQDGRDGREEQGGSAPGGAAGALAALLAVAVHGLTAALVGCGLWLLVARWGEGFQPVIGALLLGLAVVLRPRLGSLARLRKSDDVLLLERADAPQLFALLDEVAAAVGTRGVDAVVVSAEPNAGVTAYGLRRRRVLTLGLSLWTVLDRQERIALLGHEFGHYAHGDTRRLLLVGSALRTLSTWRYMLAPEPTTALVEHLANLLTLVPRLTVHGLLLLLDQTTLRASQRAEYLADATAARAAGADAAVGLMDRVLVSGATVTVLQREAVAARTRIGGAARREDPAAGLWDRLAAEVASVPDHEYARLRRVAELRAHSVDSTHPPTHLRRRLLAAGPPHTARVVLDQARAAAVDAELAEAARTVARAVVGAG